MGALDACSLLVSLYEHFIWTKTCVAVPGINTNTIPSQIWIKYYALPSITRLSVTIVGMGLKLNYQCNY